MSQTFFPHASTSRATFWEVLDSKGGSSCHLQPKYAEAQILLTSYASGFTRRPVELESINLNLVLRMLDFFLLHLGSFLPILGQANRKC